MNITPEFFLLIFMTGAFLVMVVIASQRAFRIIHLETEVEGRQRSIDLLYKHIAKHTADLDRAQVEVRSMRERHEALIKANDALSKDLEALRLLGTENGINMGKLLENYHTMSVDAQTAFRNALLSQGYQIVNNIFYSSASKREAEGWDGD